MATQAVQHDQTRVRPINCVTCNAEWDEDDDIGETFDSEDGEYFCIGDCLKVAREKSYRRQVAELVTEKFSEAMKEIEALDKLYKECLPDAVDHPYALLDDALMRATLFGEGKDSGWRDGLMLSRDEMWRIERILDNNIHKLSWDIQWDLGIHPSQPKCRLNDYSAKDRGESLAKMGNLALSLKAWRQRTEKGIEA